jgi:hypothetical protein
MSTNRNVGSALLFSIAVAVSSLTALAGPNSAPPPDFSVDGDPNKARREWMNKGNAEYVQKHWEAARDYYLKSWDIKHHYTIAANLADVEMKLGHYAGAAGYLKYVLGNIPDNKPNERKIAEEQLLECKNHLTAVRVATDVTDATVLVDGRDVGQTPLREELLLEPGKHVISVTKPGYGNKTEELSAEGSQVDVTITLEKLTAQAPPSPPPPAPSSQVLPESPKPVNKSYRLGSYIGFGVGAVGAGVGTYFLIKAHGTQSDSDSQFASCLPHCSAADKGSISDLDQAAKNQRVVGVVGLVVGGIGVGTGVTLLIIEPKEEASTTSGFVRPWFGFGQAGLYGAY